MTDEKKEETGKKEEKKEDKDKVRKGTKAEKMPKPKAEPKEAKKELKESQRKGPAVEEKPAPKPTKSIKPAQKEKLKSHIKVFNRWSSDVPVKDPGLQAYLNLNARIVPRSGGRYQKKKFYKSKIHIVERLALKLMVAGHSGKRHKISSGRNTPGFMKCLGIIERAFEVLEKKTKTNPVEVFVRALENAAVREEVTSYQVGAIIARKAVITAPQRRIDKALRYFAQATYHKSYGKKTTAVQALSDELLKAYNNSNESLAIREKERLEREAAGAR